MAYTGFTNYWLLTIFAALVYLQTVCCNECVNNTRLTNGCNTLGLFEAYKLQLTPACDEHDICYYCVSTVMFILVIIPLLEVT